MNSELSSPPTVTALCAAAISGPKLTAPSPTSSSPSRLQHCRNAREPRPDQKPRVSAEYDARPLPPLLITAGYQYAKATVTQFDPSPLSSEPGHGSPRNTFSGSIQLHSPRWGSLNFFAYSSGREYDASGNQYKLTSYSRFDVEASHQLRYGWSAYVSAAKSPGPYHRGWTHTRSHRRNSAAADRRPPPSAIFQLTPRRKAIASSSTMKRSLFSSSSFLFRFSARAIRANCASKSRPRWPRPQIQGSDRQQCNSISQHAHHEQPGRVRRRTSGFRLL